MLSFREFLGETQDVYGWLNPKGSFIRNRKGDTHGDTYLKHGGSGTLKGYGYFDTIDGAINKGWARIGVVKSDSDKSMYGVIQRDKKKWTPRHAKAWKRIKKAVGASKYTTKEVERGKGI